MLEEFIENNELAAEIISSPTELSVASAIKQRKFNPKNIAKTIMYNSKTKEEVLLIIQVGKNFEKGVLEKIMGERLLRLNDEEAFELTGYRKNFIPPISVFGVKVIIDVALENLNYLIFQISLKKYLKISLEEILAQNEDITFEKI
jgi:prolyl-tRNA editing enzyme YbaK/EbsC (Cys-tRNA(Pro) deacylase)